MLGRYKNYIAVALTLLSIYLLVPTVFSFNQIRDASEKSGESLPWYVRLFPDKQINLGLDLRGGIYLELEVDVQGALAHRSEIIASTVTRYLNEKKIAFDQTGILPKTSIVSLILKNPSDLPAVKDYVRDSYGNNLVELSKPPLLVFRMPAGSPESYQSKFQEVVAWSREQKSVLDVQLRDQDIEVTLAKNATAEEVTSAFLAKFPSGMEATPLKAGLFYTQSEAYQKTLKDETLEQAVVTIRNRIDRFGVAEPNIRKLGDSRVVVELPGAQDPERAIALVKRSGKLEFKIVDDSVPPAQVQTLIDTARTENKIPEGFTEDINVQINEALKGKIPADSEIAFETQFDPISKKVTKGIPYLLKKKVDVSGEMLSNTQVKVEHNDPYVAFTLDSTGTKAFGDLTTANQGKRLAILLDGVVTKAPEIKTAITGGEAQITLGQGDYNSLLKEAQDLVLVLKEGALPARLTEATKTVIGPSLGKTSIDRGFHSTLLAALIVMVFMAVWYKGSGLLADLAVTLNVLFIFSALTLFGGTLTLPGVAGIVLTIGMAVDANVIILERIKEELAAGRSIKAAVDAGYSNGIRAVVDANMTTFFSGAILYYFGTGPVRGFAVTLMIGIATTLFTGVVLTRSVYEYILSRYKITKLSI